MIRSDTKRQPERPYTAPPRRGPPRAAKKLRLRPRACPAAASAAVNRRDCAHAGKCCCIAAAAHIVYLGLWRFLGAALLGVMRFIERPVARARLLLAECGQSSRVLRRGCRIGSADCVPAVGRRQGRRKLQHTMRRPASRPGRKAQAGTNQQGSSRSDCDLGDDHAR